MSNSARLFDRLKAGAYGLGRRSALARAMVARLRRLRRATFGPSEDYVRVELGALFAFLRDSQCTFHNCTTMATNPQALAVAFRYDIHVRDLAVSGVFVEAHRTQGIPASFYLFWDHSHLERSYIGEFQKLASRIATPSEIGLHDSPVDTYLIQSRFRFDRGAYWAWLNSPDAVKWIAALATDPARLEEFDAAVFRNFVARVHETQERFGPILSVAAHGGDLRRALMPRLEELGPEGVQTARALFAAEWLTPGRVTAAGLKTCADAYRQTNGNLRQVTDGGGRIRQMTHGLQNGLRRGSAMQILLHPFTWDGARRDGELSDLFRVRQRDPKE